MNKAKKNRYSYLSSYKGIDNIMDMVDGPIVNKQYLKSLIEYVTELHKFGILSEIQLTTIITNICSNFIENEISLRLEEKLNRSLYNHFDNMKLSI